MRIPLGISLKRFLPRTLLGRSLLILLAPMVLAQLVATFMFFDRHWDSLTNRLAYGVAGDIALAAAIVERHDETAELLALMARNTDLRITLRPGKTLPDIRQPDSYISRILARNLRLRLNDDSFRIENRAIEDSRLVFVTTSRGMLEVLVPERRLYNASGYLFLYWMMGSAFFFFAIAVLFMRNQVRPIRRLAIAAEAFGMGREVAGFKPAGALEVRQAAQAFIQMKERLKRQIRQRTEMLAGVSHDLRTPLTRMKLQLALMPQDEGFEELQHDIRDMERMVEGYLAFARGEGDEQAVSTDFTALLASVIEDAGRISQRPVGFTAPPPLTVMLRPQDVRRALANLLTNALRYAGQVNVSCEITESRVNVHVDDDGPGIPADKRRDVLRPFVRLDESRNLDTGGVGLGLTIARDMAQAHGGSLTLSDSPMGGLRATLSLPR